MEEIAISKFKATCLAVLQEVRQTGQPILVTRRGEPIAEINPPARPRSAHQWLGSAADSGRVIGDLVAPATDASTWEALGP